MEFSLWVSVLGSCIDGHGTELYSNQTDVTARKKIYLLYITFIIIFFLRMILLHEYTFCIH
jgi:hypothetical protein